MDDKIPLNDVELNKLALPEPSVEEITAPLVEAPQEEVSAPPKQLTEEEQRQQMEQMHLVLFAAYGDATRQQLAKNRGLLKDGKPTEKLIALGVSKAARDGGYAMAFDENEQVKPEDLRKFVPLPGDTVVYAVDPKTKLARLALDKNGFIAFPKQKGRIKKHISKKENSIKALALRAFPIFFAEHGGKLLLEAKAAAAKEGKEFDAATFGVPEADMPDIYKKATMAGAAMYARNAKAVRRQRRRQQQLSRYINAQRLPSGSVAAHKYFIFGVPGGAGKPCRAVVIRKEQEKAKEAENVSRDSK